MMLDILITSLCLSAAIMGLWICFNWQGMIFEPLAYKIEELFYTHKIPHVILKPFWQCPTCMSSVWGFIFYLSIGKNYLSIAEMIMVVLMTAFLNTLFCILLTKTTDEGCG